MTETSELMKVLFVGEMPTGSSPLLTLAQAVEPYRILPLFSEGAEAKSTRRWLDLLRTSRLVLFVGYHGPDPYMIRQLALAAVLGKPIVRWWVGSDVLYCLQDPLKAHWARLADKLRSTAITGAPHLQKELASVGLAASLIPTVVNPELLKLQPSQGPMARDVLVYLPTHRGAFYGEEVIKQAIETNPDLKFIVVGDAQHRFEGYCNVESLGWVENMQPVYERTGCLLRMTEHDSLPRMAIETLLLAKYVICSYEFPGCWTATNFQEVQRWIAVFRACTRPNESGRLAIRKLLTPAPGVQFAAVFQQVAAKRSLTARVAGILKIVPLTLSARALERKHFA